MSRIGTLTKEGDVFDERDFDTQVKILQENQDSCHRDMNKTYEAIKRYYVVKGSWDSLYVVKSYILWKVTMFMQNTVDLKE
jgi:hypothetical protein